MRWIRSGLLLAAFALAATAGAAPRDYADSRNAAAWLRHPVYGDPSFDSFERTPGNPIHRGSAPFEWPVNGFLFLDPVSGNWYVYVGDYGKGYMTPPSRCLLYRSTDTGRTWDSLGVVLQGDPLMFDRGGHTPDVSVVYADRRYHMVYDWGEANFNAEGGLAYAWADRPEGPWHRAPEPLTRNTALSKLIGRYQRTYAPTLVRRSHDWMILAMMDHAPHGWALFAMTSPKPDGPYSERRLVRNVEADYFHPPLMEFFPAFVHKGFVYAPATSVALNRNFNAIFRAALEQADEPSAWTVFQHGSVWHAEDSENEHFGIWGQTFSGAFDGAGLFHAMFPSRDSQGRGTINLAQRPWHQPLRKRGFVLTGHDGPSLTLLRDAYDDFDLELRFRLRGTARLLFDYAAPLMPNVPSSDATLHPIMNTRHTAIEFAPGTWRLLRLDAAGNEAVVASGSLSTAEKISMQVSRSGGSLALSVNSHSLWIGVFPADPAFEFVGAIGLRVEKNTHFLVEKFQVQGKARPARITFGATDALLGVAESPADWEERRDAAFRFGLGATSRQSAARAKWNFIGSRLQLWSPRSPQFGKVRLRLDGRGVGSLDLRAEQLEPSRVVWKSRALREGFHALLLDATDGELPLDSVDVFGGNAGRH